MATKKKVGKSVAKKPVSKTVKKAAPLKRQHSSATKRVIKSPLKNHVAKKPVKAAKPKFKTAVKPITKHAKPVAKKNNTPSLKSKSVAKSLPKKTTKLLLKSTSKKTAPLHKPIVKPMTKKIDIKKPVVKELVKASPKILKDIKVSPPKPVVIPKFNTKTSRKYQPDFTKSVLDQPKNDPGAPIMRYNDSDLAEFRELIQRKLNAAKKELSYLQGLITRKDEMGGDESDNRYMTMEDGSLSMEREQLSQMASRQITFIDHLEKALMRIENKTYGICRVTGKLIDKARLRAVPHATLCIEAKMGIVK